MKVALGVLILVAVFIGLFALMARHAGFWVTAGIWAGSLATTGAIVLGLWLIGAS